jgi:hypothetical protein
MSSYHRKHASRTGKTLILIRLVLICAVFSVMASIAVLIALHKINRTPRELALYIEHRAAGHRPSIVAFSQWFADYLRQNDRMAALNADLPNLLLGAQKNGAPAVHQDIQRQVTVANIEQLRAALQAAQAGDEITIAPGHYVLSEHSLLMNQPGTAEAPITLRAKQLGTVKIDSMIAEGFIVSAPFYSVENLDIQGLCNVQEFCEHAFHVIGKAHHFTAHNNRITDFNAHLKINGEHGSQPDYGQMMYNTISNSAPRNTAHAVTPVDLVAASDWYIRKNIVSDFIKAGGDKISYGMFVKGAGADNRIEQNLIICEHKLQNYAGQRVGLSLGGGGTGAAYCRDQHCVVEQERGVLQANLVMACSDDGIYLNKAADSTVRGNTLIDTSGITVRFPQSAAHVTNNLVDSLIRERDGGLVHAQDNQQANMLNLYLGHHAVRGLFHAPASFDFTWEGVPPSASSAQLNVSPMLDLCTNPTSAKNVFSNDRNIVIGAFHHFPDCIAPH